METSIKTIKFSGILASKFGHVHRMAVRNVAEAMRALCITVPGFEKFLMESKDRGFDFAVIVGGVNVPEEEMKNPTGADEIRLIPILRGSKKGGIVNIVAGVVLIAIGAVVQWYAGGPNPVSNYLYGAGISMIVGGVIQLLVPMPKIKDGDRKDDKRSYIFNGPVNVSAQGGSVPYLAGEMYTGSVVISAGISAQDNYVVPTGDDVAGGITKGKGMGGDYEENY